jgi:hypothetical protein
MQVATEPDEAAGQLEEPEIVRGLLLVADEEAATFGEPGQCPLDSGMTWVTQRVPPLVRMFKTCPSR